MNTPSIYLLMRDCLPYQRPPFGSTIDTMVREVTQYGISSSSKPK